MRLILALVPARLAESGNYNVDKSLIQIQCVRPLRNCSIKKPSLHFLTLLSKASKKLRLSQAQALGRTRNLLEVISVGRDMHTMDTKEKNQCPREGMFSGSFAKARGRDKG